jgi:hypothetical protein
MPPAKTFDNGTSTSGICDYQIEIVWSGSSIRERRSSGPCPQEIQDCYLELTERLKKLSVESSDKLLTIILLISLLTMFIGLLVCCFLGFIYAGLIPIFLFTGIAILSTEFKRKKIEASIAQFRELLRTQENSLLNSENYLAHFWAMDCSLSGWYLRGGCKGDKIILEASLIYRQVDEEEALNGDKIPEKRLEKNLENGAKQKLNSISASQANTGEHKKRLFTKKSLSSSYREIKKKISEEMITVSKPGNNKSLGNEKNGEEETPSKFLVIQEENGLPKADDFEDLKTGEIRTEERTEVEKEERKHPGMYNIRKVHHAIEKRGPTFDGVLP